MGRNRKYQPNPDVLSKKFNVERDILFYALRYAIGRQTFACPTVIDNVQVNDHLFSVGDYMMMIRDILEHREMFGKIGAKIDDDAWMNFVDWLNKRILEKSDDDGPAVNN